MNREAKIMKLKLELLELRKCPQLSNKQKREGNQNEL